MATEPQPTRGRPVQPVCRTRRRRRWIDDALDRANDAASDTTKSSLIMADGTEDRPVTMPLRESRWTMTVSLLFSTVLLVGGAFVADVEAFVAYVGNDSPSGCIDCGGESGDQCLAGDAVDDDGDGSIN